MRVLSGLNLTTFTLNGVGSGTNFVTVGVGEYATSVVVTVSAAGLALTGPPSAEVMAGDTAQMSVSRPAGSTAADLVVTLESQSPSELSVPASVTIPAGQTNAVFTISGISPLVGVIVEARATGYDSVTAGVTLP